MSEIKSFKDALGAECHLQTVQAGSPDNFLRLGVKEMCMLLNKDKARLLWPHIKHFAETGELLEHL
jgi:hypothetical protein